MKINPEDYNYKALAVGASVKYPHVGCSSSLALKVTVDVKGCLFHCFKCNETTFVPFEGQSWRDRKQREAEKAAFDSEKAKAGYALPVDFTRTITSAGLGWLGRGGWTTDLIDRYNIGWSDNLNRVIIPLQPEGYIARAVFEDQKPKYIAKAPDHSRWLSHSPTGGRLVVVEDVLSAGRLGKFLPAQALLGTSGKWIPPGNIDTVVIWTDHDAAGHKARLSIQNTCSWMGLDVTHIVTDLDPKVYSDDEIRRHLGSIL